MERGQKEKAGREEGEKVMLIIPDRDPRQNKELAQGKCTRAEGAQRCLLATSSGAPHLKDN